MSEQKWTSELEVGDMVDLEGDIIVDPACELGCPHRTQNVEVVEIEHLDGYISREESWMLVRFRNNEDAFEGTFPSRHSFTLA